jgi:hypothetical protein
MHKFIYKAPVYQLEIVRMYLFTKAKTDKNNEKKNHLKIVSVY